MSAEISSVMGSKDVAAVAAPAAAEARTVVGMSKPAVQDTAEASRQALRAALQGLNQEMSESNKGLHFSMDERLGRSIITVEDTRTGKVIRQIPDPAALKVAYNIEQLKGVLLDEDI